MSQLREWWFLRDHTFTITNPSSVPQFPLGFVILFVILIPALLVLKERMLSLGRLSV